jgi:hypothetical protein
MQLDIGGGTVTNRYGIRINPFSGSVTTDDFSIYNAATQKSYFAGNVGIGTTSPTAALYVQGPNAAASTDAISALDVNGGTGGVSAGGNVGGPINLTGGVGGFASVNPVGGKGGTITIAGGLGGGGQLPGYKGSGGDVVLKGGIGSAGANGVVILQPTAGNVGIGTTAPAVKLAVMGNVGIGVNYDVANLTIHGTPSTGEGSPTNIYVTDSSAAAMGVGAGITLGGKAQSGSESTWGFGNIRGIKENSTNANIASALTFSTRSNGASFTEKMRISSAGNVGIGTTAPGYALDVGGGTTGYDIRGYDVYTHDGGVTSFSDQRLKTIEGGYSHGLNEIMALNPSYYHYKSTNPLGLASQETVIGLMAQDVQKLIPEAVQMSTSGYLTMSQGPIFYAMINAVKEQQGMIIQQQAKNAEQETVISDVNLKTSQNVETVQELQKTVDDNLSVISSNFSAVDTKLALQDSQMANVNSQLTALDTQVSAIDTQLADLAAQYSDLSTGMSLSGAEKTDLESRLTFAENSLVESEHNLITFEKGTNDTLSSMLDTEDMLTERVLDHEDRIKSLEDKLATATVTAGGEIPANVVTQDASGNVTLAGLFKAKEVEANGVVAGSVTVRNEKESAAPTMGDGEIKPVPVDVDGDGIDDVTKEPVAESDGKIVEINTKAVSETAKVFVTFENDPGARYWVEKVKDSVTGEYTGFSLKLSEVARSDVKFSWWIVELK